MFKGMLFVDETIENPVFFLVLFAQVGCTTALTV
jgi:hypothetical protein